jgi:hypothetical protein
MDSNINRSGIEQLLQAAGIMKTKGTIKTENLSPPNSTQLPTQEITQAQKNLETISNIELLNLNNLLPADYRVGLSPTEITHIHVKHKIAVLHHTMTTIEKLKHTKEELYQKIDSKRPYNLTSSGNDKKKKMKNSENIYDTESDDESKQFKQEFNDEKLRDPNSEFKIFFVPDEDRFKFNGNGEKNKSRNGSGNGSKIGSGNGSKNGSKNGSGNGSKTGNGTKNGKLTNS